MKTPVSLLLLSFAAASALRASEAKSTAPDLAEALHIVARQKAIFAAPPALVPTKRMNDGPLLGNGDLAVVMAGTPEEMRFYIGKNDFWGRTIPRCTLSKEDLAAGATKFAHTGNVGRLLVGIPALKGGSYRQEQSMAAAEVCGTFTKGQLTVHSQTRVDANSNLLLTELSCEGDSADLVISQTVGGGTSAVKDTNGNSRGGKGIEFNDAILWAFRDADPLPGSRRAAFSTRVLGAPAVADDEGGVRVKLAPGVSVTLATAIASDLDAASPAMDATGNVRALTKSKLTRLAAEHSRWWADFWGRSFIEIPDKEIEKRWYAALYTLGSCNRAGKIPAGLWGWVTADVADWCGAYTLNYNFEAPYYLADTSNHPDLEENYFKVISDFVPKARKLAKIRGFKGIYFPTGIGPWGWHYGPANGSEGFGAFPEFADFAQRSNAAFVGVNFITHWKTTQDDRFLRETGYPYLRGVAEFWEDYLKFENGRYVDYHDAIHEEYSPGIPTSADVNPLVSIGLVKMLFKELIPMSEVLGVDAGKRAKWKDISEKISSFATQERNGKTIFRYTEKGKAWHPDNALGIQHIYPASAIGLDSDPKLLEIGRNTIDAMARWSDNNGGSTWYPACARIGYDPKIILAKLRHECDTHSMPNLVLRYNGGGLENCGIFAAVTEMLLQSHEGVIRLFPCWPADQNARFGNLRACGALLISAELQGGTVNNVRITSEKGRDCTVVNPWPRRSVQIVRSGKAAQIIEGDRVTFATHPGETIELQSAAAHAQ